MVINEINITKEMLYNGYRVAIGYQYDHNSTKIIFSEYNGENFYLILQRINGNTYEPIPLMEGGIWWVSASYTTKKTSYYGQIMEKIGDEYISCSPIFIFDVKESLPSDGDQIEEVIPPNFELAYEEMVRITKEIEEKLKNGDFIPAISIGEVNTLPEKSEATVEMTGSKESPIFNFGIPQGISAKFGTPTITVGDNTGIPTANITTSGDNENKIFNFSFDNLRAGFGDLTAEIGDRETNPTVVLESSGEFYAKNFHFKFDGIKGNRGLTPVFSSDEEGNLYVEYTDYNGDFAEDIAVIRKVKTNAIFTKE